MTHADYQAALAKIVHAPATLRDDEIAALYAARTALGDLATQARDRARSHAPANTNHGSHFVQRAVPSLRRRRATP